MNMLCGFMNDSEKDFPIPINLTDYKFTVGDLFEDSNGKTIEVLDRFESHCYLDDEIVYIPYYILSKENDESLYVDENIIIKENL